ncbi:HEPN domain-containing protein [Salmonirosea aquatica]|uniref:HEPN domain-containing protein n=1 Tax=Salmonirosea aquatica TaxID=2654236 RepID=A0A7C9BSR0_9BACT|nr:HEPN domain-containing protein [Cytophagaceae bacterium SJW1-29]
MKEDEKQAYVLYRLESAHKALAAAKACADIGLWNSAMNRLYYAVYYAVSALLFINDIQAKTHSATKSQFAQYFVKTGIFDQKYSRLLAILYDGRQKGDYEDFFEADKETIQIYSVSAKEMIEAIESKIKSE